MAFGTVSLGEAVLDLSADANQLERDMGRAKRSARGVFDGIQRSATRILEFATSQLLVGGIRKIVSGIQQIGSSAIEAVGHAQNLEKGLEGLLTESLMYEEVTRTRRIANQSSEEEARALHRTSLEYQVATAELAEYQEKLSEADEVTAEHQLRLMDLQDDVSGYAGEMDELKSGMGGYSTVTETSYEQVMSFAEAQEAAREKTQDLLGFIEELSIISPFETTQVESMARYALAAQMGVEQTKEFSQAFLDYAYVHGITSENLGFAADQMLQLRKTGKLTTIDLRQLRRLGIDLGRILGIEMGMSVDEFNSKVEQSPELMDQLFDSFVEYSNRVAGGASEAAATSIDTLFSTAGDIMEIGSRKLFRPMVEAASPYISDLLEGIASFVTGGELEAIGIKAGESLGLGISGALAMLSGDEMGKYEIGAALSNLFGMEVGQGFIDTADKVGEFLDALKGIGESPAVQTAIGVIDQLFSYFQGRAPGALEDSSRVFSAWATTIGSFTRNEALPWFLDQVQKITGWLSENAELIDANSARWALAFERVLGWVGQLATAGWQGLSGAIGGTVDVLLGLAEAFMKVSTGDYAGAWESVKEGIANANASINEGLWKMANTVTGWLGTDWETVKGQWSSAWEDFKEIVRLLWSNVQEKWDALVADIERGVGDIQTFFTDTLPTAIDDAKTAIEGKIEELKQAGRDLLGGLISGVEEKKTALRNMLQGVANVIPGWLKSWLGIESPSRVTWPIGEMVIAGMGEGMLEGAKKLVNETFPKIERRVDIVPRLAQAVAPPLSPTLATVGAIAPPARGMSVEINFGDVSVRNDGDMDEIARRVVREIQRHQRR